MPILIVSDPSTGTSKRVEIDEQRLRPLIGTRIGQTIDGTLADMQNYKLRLTGGTDKDGIPMRPDVHGSAKAQIILSGGVGYNPPRKGELKRKVVRGNMVSAVTTYLNFTIVEAPKSRRKKEPKPEEPKEEAPPAEEEE
jgi:small subunit ribosomal protein S6e